MNRQSWILTLAMLAVVVGVLIIAPLSSHHSPTNLWLTTVGSAMGAVFAAAGLLIGLIAVITLLSLDDRIDRAYQRAHEELMPQFEEQANAQIEAHFQAFYAKNAGDWQTAEHLTQDALTRYPGLKGARAFLGTKLSDTALAHYKLVYAVWDRLSLRAQAWGWSTREAPVAEAIKWLESALEHGEGQDGLIKVHLALMYGLNSRPDKMLDEIREIDGPNRQTLLLPDHLMALAVGCSDDLSSLERLGQTLGVELPVTAATLQSWLDAVDVTNMPGVLDVWAIRASAWQWVVNTPSSWPTQLRFRISTGTDGDRKAEMSWMVHGSQPVTAPDAIPMVATTAQIATEACTQFSILGPTA